MTAAYEEISGTASAAGAGDLMAWAEGSGCRRVEGPSARGGLRFVFYGGSTED
jgi:hypothetical protein